METWKTNLEETKKRYIDWWNHKGIILNMWEHFQKGVKPHADIPAPAPAKDLNQKWFDPQWRAEYLDWYVAHSSLKADILPVANTQLGPGSLAAILGGVFEGGEDTIWIHPDPDFNDEIVFNPEHPNWILHKELLKACKAKANGHYYVGMPDLMEGLDVLAALKGTDKVLLDTVMQPEVLEQQMQQINDIYFKVGLITTIGLSAKNAILIVEVAREFYREGMNAAEAAVAAAKLRLRPILMTSLAFGAGVIPLAFAHGAAAGAQRAVGTGVLGGIITATLLAIFLVPLFFRLTAGKRGPDHPEGI